MGPFAEGSVEIDKLDAGFHHCCLSVAEKVTIAAIGSPRNRPLLR